MIKSLLKGLGNAAAGKAEAPAPGAQVSELTTSVKGALNSLKAMQAKVTPQLQAANVRVYKHARGKADKAWLKLAASSGAVKELLGAFEPSALERLPSPALEKKYDQLSEVSTDAGSFFARRNPETIDAEDRPALPSLRELTAELARRSSKVKAVLTQRPDTQLGRARQGRALKLADIAAQQASVHSANRHGVQDAHAMASRQKSGAGLYDEEITER